MAITYVGQAGVSGANETSPHAITYTSVSGHTLILAGYLDLPGASAPPYLTSVTDSTSGANTWQFSTGTAQNPPCQGSQQIQSGGWVIEFVAWCLNAAAVTSVSFAFSGGGSTWTRVTLSEWAGVGAYDSSFAATGTGLSSTGSLTLGNAGDLVVGAGEGDNASMTLPAGWTDFTSQANVAGYCLPGVSGTYSPSWGFSAGNVWGAAVAAFTPGGGAVTPAVLAVTTSVPAVLVNVTPVTPAVVAAAASVPAVTVTYGATVTSRPGQPAIPGMARPGLFTPGRAQARFTLGAAASAAVPAVTVTTPGASTSGPNYATAYGTPVGGAGTWVNPANAENAPDSTYAVWTVV